MSTQDAKIMRANEIKEMLTKADIKKRYGIKCGRIQISSHGCGKHSVQVFVSGKLVRDFDL